MRIYLQNILAKFHIPMRFETMEPAVAFLKRSPDNKNKKKKKKKISSDMGSVPDPQNKMYHIITLNNGKNQQTYLKTHYML